MPKIKKVIEVDAPHRVGNIYWNDYLGSHYILSQVLASQVCLIGLDDHSNRAIDPVAVRNSRDITETEWKTISGENLGSFELIGLFSEFYEDTLVNLLDD